MKKKITITLLAICVALSCAFSLAACDDNPFKLKDESQYKQAIADICTNCEFVTFSASLEDKDTERDLADIYVHADGKAQYLRMNLYSYDEDGHQSKKSEEYYYDGEYVYLNVEGQGYDFKWGKMKLELTENVPAPVSYIDKVYSGEIWSLFDLDYSITVYDLDEMSNRYADMEFTDDYELTDGDFKYTIHFQDWDKTPHGIDYRIESSEFELLHIFMREYDNVVVPTESVKDMSNTDD